MRPLRSPVILKWICAVLAGLSLPVAINFLLIAFATEFHPKIAFLLALLAFASAGHWLALMTIIGLLDRIANRT